MKKIIFTSSVLSLMIIFASCTNSNENAQNIYDKIHSLYYSVGSYQTSCSVTVFTKSGENKYECNVSYDKNSNTYKVIYDDMDIFLSEEKSVITKEGNTIESPSVKEDMYIFINSFFESYYECEDTSVKTNSSDKSKTVILECSVINPTDYISSMKLWIFKDTAMPYKMQIFSSDGACNTEVVFKDFKFKV